VPVTSASPILVLVNPQDIVNIASAVRIAKNFGIERMRLVDPEIFDPYRIEGIAHNTAEFVARIEIVPTLAEAVADCVQVAVLTGRGPPSGGRCARAKPPPSSGRRPSRARSRWWRGGRTAGSPTPSSISAGWW
jgi:tRNA C32,U32 (ribose-2'-O)-methylase TrmJ